MKHLNNYIIEKLRINKDSKFHSGKTTTIIDRIYMIRGSDDEVINIIIDDFVQKCVVLVDVYKNPNSVLNSVKTYEYFYNEFGTDTNEDFSDWKKIYHDIPVKICKELWNKYGINKMDMNDFENMFGAGEFPIINIFRKNNNVIYNITR